MIRSHALIESEKKTIRLAAAPTSVKHYWSRGKRSEEDLTHDEYRDRQTYRTRLDEETDEDCVGVYRQRDRHLEKRRYEELRTERNEERNPDERREVYYTDGWLLRWTRTGGDHAHKKKEEIYSLVHHHDIETGQTPSYHHVLFPFLLIQLPHFITPGESLSILLEVYVHPRRHRINTDSKYQHQGNKSLPVGRKNLLPSDERYLSERTKIKPLNRRHRNLWTSYRNPSSERKTPLHENDVVSPIISYQLFTIYLSIYL